MSLGRALRLTAAKQADRLMSLPLATLGVTQRRGGAADLAPLLEGDRLILMMDGPDGQAGAVLLEPVLVAGLLQQQTMGRVAAVLPDAPARRHTATDAAMCAPFAEALLARAALLPERERERALLTGYRYGVWAREPRLAKLALDGPDYHVIEMTLDLAAGTRTGKLTLVLPAPVAAPRPQEAQDGAAPDTARSTTNLTDTVMGLKAELTIALARVTLPLKKLTALGAGDVLALGVAGMGEALVLDAAGKAVSRGTLGQIDGMRAVQVQQARKGQQMQPRRRATDREMLDLPDVTEPRTTLSERPDPLDPPDVPSLSDVDIFGDIDDLPELPDIDEAAEAADATMAQWDMPQDSDDEHDVFPAPKQAGW